MLIKKPYKARDVQLYCRAIVRCSGIVQGIGFRPFIYRLAVGKGLKGYVVNLGDAGVKIELEGEEEKIKEFLIDLREKKPFLAKYENISVSFLDEILGYEKFEIRESEKKGVTIHVRDGSLLIKRVPERLQRETAGDRDTFGYVDYGAYRNVQIEPFLLDLFVGVVTYFFKNETLCRIYLFHTGEKLGNYVVEKYGYSKVEEYLNLFKDLGLFEKYEIKRKFGVFGDQIVILYNFTIGRRDKLVKVINRIIEIFGKQEKPDEYYVEVYRNSVNDFVRGIMTGVLQGLYKKPEYVIPPSCVKRYDDRIEVTLNLYKVKEV